MPLTRPAPNQEQLWKASDTKAMKNSKDHKCVYAMNGDEYRGDWKDNLRHGKGLLKMKSKDMLYNGDWVEDKRHGFGLLSKGDGKGGYMKLYAGGWKFDKKHGYGTAFYGGASYYEGEWYNGVRHGRGRIIEADGAVYDGGYQDDNKSGYGEYTLANGNYHKGEWKEGKMHGPGVFYYTAKRQVYTGTWVNGGATTGSLQEVDDMAAAPELQRLNIPQCELRDIPGVLRAAAEEALALAES